MDHATTEIRTEQWRQIVLEANGSSLTKKEFCRQNGIKEKQFYYWQRKIRRQESSRLRLEATLAPVESTSVVSSCSSSSFVTVNLSEPEDTSSIPLSLSSTFHPELMIQMNGVNLFVVSSVHEETLQSVIRVLRNA
jgi:putative transposase